MDKSVIDMKAIRKACIEAAKPYWRFLIFMESLKRKENTTLVESISRGALVLFEAASDYINTVFKRLFGPNFNKYLAKYGMTDTEKAGDVLQKTIDKEYNDTVSKNVIENTIAEAAPDRKTFKLSEPIEGDVVGKKFRIEKENYVVNKQEAKFTTDYRTIESYDNGVITVNTPFSAKKYPEPGDKVIIKDVPKYSNKLLTAMQLFVAQRAIKEVTRHISSTWDANTIMSEEAKVDAFVKASEAAMSYLTAPKGNSVDGVGRAAQDVILSWEPEYSGKFSTLVTNTLKPPGAFSNAILTDISVKAGLEQTPKVAWKPGIAANIMDKKKSTEFGAFKDVIVMYKPGSWDPETGKPVEVERNVTNTMYARKLPDEQIKSFKTFTELFSRSKASDPNAAYRAEMRKPADKQKFGRIDWMIPENMRNLPPDHPAMLGKYWEKTNVLEGNTLFNVAKDSSQEISDKDGSKSNGGDLSYSEISGDAKTDESPDIIRIRKEAKETSLSNIDKVKCQSHPWLVKPIVRNMIETGYYDSVPENEEEFETMFLESYLDVLIDKPNPEVSQRVDTLSPEVQAEMKKLVGSADRHAIRNLINGPIFDAFGQGEVKHWISNDKIAAKEMFKDLNYLVKLSQTEHKNRASQGR